MIKFDELLRLRCLVGNVWILVTTTGQEDDIYDLLRIPDELITAELLIKKGFKENYLDYYVRKITFTDYRSTCIVLTDDINDSL